MDDRPWQGVRDGLRLDVRLTPRGGRDAIDGIEVLADGRPVLRCRVRALPSEGEANAALVTLLAKALGLPKRDVTLVAGAASRSKSLVLRGEATLLIARLEALAAGA